MMLLSILLVAAIGLLAFVSWKIASMGRSHEVLENLRRDLSDAKDKIEDRLGKNADSIQQRLEKTLELVNKQLGGMDNRIDKRVAEINQRLDSAAKLMSMVQKQYGTVEELSGSIKQLHEAFRAPKLRGGFGERALVDLVERVLPVKAYAVQYTFKSGVIVDILLKTTNGSIPIDAKFPMENYVKLIADPSDESLRKSFGNDVKKHIRDIAKKYILPDEGTLEFALMYVPSDAVLYEILTNGELSDLAESQHVFILSPHSFYYFLNIIRLAYQSQQFEENAKQILSLIRGIQQQNMKLGEDLAVLQRHVGNASSKMGEVLTTHTKLDVQIRQASMLESAEKSKKASITDVADAKVKQVTEAML